MRDAFKVLKRGGWIFFSCERAAEDGPDLVLEKSLRYSHKASHVRTLLDQLGFVACEFEDVDLRTENGVAIPGFIVSAQSRCSATTMPAAIDHRLIVAISSRALFDLSESHAVYERDGVEAYQRHQVAHENELLQPGVAF